MDLFYTDAQMSMLDLAASFGTSKGRVLKILKGMGTPRRQDDFAPVLLFAPTATGTHRFRSKSDALAFAQVAAAIKDSVHSAEVRVSEDGRYVEVEFQDVIEAMSLLKHLSGQAFMDEEPDSLYSRLSSWKITGPLSTVIDQGAEQGYTVSWRPTLTFPVRDLVRLSVTLGKGFTLGNSLSSHKDLRAKTITG